MAIMQSEELNRDMLMALSPWLPAETRARILDGSDSKPRIKL